MNNLEIFKEFNNKMIDNLSVNEILVHSLEIFSQLINTDFIAIYLFNKETFLPELQVISENKLKKESDTILEEIIEEGILSDVMNSNHIIKRNLPKHNLILAPLVSFKGAHGFVVFRTISSKEIEDNNTEYLLENFTGYLASCINSRFLDLENESIRNQIDQVVAVQTKSLMDKKKEINEKIEELKSSLLMTMPHEVRTPLNQILGLTDYLIKSVKDVDEEELTEVLNDVYESAVRLRRLFENYLYLSTLNITAYDIEKLNQLKNSILPSAESVIYESAMNLAFKYEKQESIELNLVDTELNITEEHLSKLLFEIIDNAFKFGDENTKVNISSELSNNNYIIKILDNGIGIPIERIYLLDAYIQFDRLSNEQQGSGLGLAIAKRIAIIYDGDIQFKSKPNDFTEVTITLPVASN